MGLSALAALDGGLSHVGRSVSAQPLFAEHSQEGGEERDGETGEEDGLNLDYCTERSGPLWENGNLVSKSGVVDLVNEDTEKRGGLVVGIRLELRVDVGGEGRGKSRRQTRLVSRLAHVHPTPT